IKTQIMETKTPATTQPVDAPSDIGEGVVIESGQPQTRQPLPLINVAVEPAVSGDASNASTPVEQPTTQSADSNTDAREVLESSLDQPVQAPAASTPEPTAVLKGSRRWLHFPYKRRAF